jgi:MYXO-CTERM domain-containing protein
MPRLLPCTVGLLAALAPAAVAAQIPYSVVHTSQPYVPITGGTVHSPVAYGAFPALDEGAVQLTLPFSFTWYGVPHTTVWAYTNGFLGFQAPNTMGILRPPRAVPSPANPMHDFIGAFWTDLSGGANTALRTLVTGAPGARVFTVQWENFEKSGASPGTTSANFQVRLHEGTQAVELAYGPNNAQVSITAALENGDGTDGVNLMASSASCDAVCACAPGNCLSANFGVAGGRLISVTLPNQPELQGSLQVPPGAYPGTSFDVVATVINAGLAPAGAFSYAVLLSTSPTSVSGARTLGTFSLPGLAAVGTVTATHTLSVPADAPVGELYLVLSVDTGAAITEVDETNNLAFAGPFRTGPDLLGTVSGPAETGPGEAFDVQLDLQTAGAPVAGPVRVQFYLSPTPTLGGSSVPVTPAVLVTFPDGFSTSQTLTLTAPLALPPSPPTYSVLAVVDDADAIPETDETNNLLVSPGTVDVRGAELEATDLVGGDFGFRGLPYPLTTVVRNTGAATARDFTVCVFLSENLLISVVSDLKLFETPLMTLAPGESRTLRLEPMVPVGTATGAWYVATVADCTTVVNEPVETNNTRRRLDPITVLDPSPDLAPLEVATASAAAAGETAPVAARVGNLGNAPGAAPVRFVLSDNPGVTAQDVLLFETAAPLSLAPGAEATVSAWAALPGDLPTGNYYLGVVVDPQGSLPEILEDNNALGFGPLLVLGSDLAVVSPAPPNALIGNPYAWRFAAAGGAEGYTFALTWDSGAAPAGLSFDPGRAELGGTPTPAAEGSHPFTLRVTSGSRATEVRYTLQVTPPTLPLTVVSSRLPPGLAREPYAVTLVAVGGVPPYQWSMGSAGPAGLAVSPEGVLGGEPQLVGPASFTVVVRDQSSQRAVGRLSIDIVDPAATLTITTANLPTGVVQEAYQSAFNAAGGQPPYTWTLTGPVPPGLEFQATTAQLTGTPTVAGDYELMVEVRDAAGLFDRNAYTLQVFEQGALRISTGNEEADRLPDGTKGEPYTAEDGSPARLRAVPPEGTTWFLANGALPPGLSLDAASGVIAGTPTEAGPFAFTVMVKNQANDVRRAALVIFVADKADAPTPVPEGCGCRSEGAPTSQGGLLMAALGLLLVARRRRGA